MASQVKVTSFDALESFRASLILFLKKANRSVDEVRDEVRRTRQWIQHDRRMHWEGEAHRWRKKLDQSQQELMSARLSGLRETTAAQQAAVLKAKRMVAEADDKLRKVKLWNRDYDGCVDPIGKRLEGLRDFLDHDMPKAIAYLVQALRTLEAYAETSSQETKPAPASAAPENFQASP